MTSNPNTALQLRHLWAASHLLATTSPTVSAHLATRLLSISSEKGINLPDSVERGVCNACGTVAVWGLNSHVSTTNKRKGKCKVKTIVFECHMCGRSRASAIPPARKKRSARKPKLKAAATISAVPAAVAKAEAKAELSVAQSSKSQAQSLANASSRKRAKSRKGNSLSEILKAKKKQQASSGGAGGGFGLDLMDLMKTG